MTVYPETLPRPSALLFDWDNTLIDSWATIHLALEETFQAFGREAWTLEELKPESGRPRAIPSTAL